MPKPSAPVTIDLLPVDLHAIEHALAAARKARDRAHVAKMRLEPDLDCIGALRNAQPYALARANAEITHRHWGALDRQRRALTGKATLHMAWPEDCSFRQCRIASDIYLLLLAQVEYDLACEMRAELEKFLKEIS